MSTPFVIPAGRMLRDASWLFDRELERQDNAALAQYDRREAIEKKVTRAELLEEVSETFTSAQDEVFMTALARDDAYTLLALLDQTKQNIIKRRLAQGE